MSRGFTLLEVSVALAVLAIGLVSVVDINAGAARLHEQSKHLTTATLLAKGKMIDLEQKLNEDGFSDFDQQIDGTFEEQGHPEIRWHAEILKPDTSKAQDQLTQLVTGALGGGTPGAGSPSDSNGASGSAGNSLSMISSFLSQNSLIPSGSNMPSALSSLIPSASSSSTDPAAAAGPAAAGLGGLMGGAMTGLIQAQVQQLVTLIQSGVREARLTVTWPDGNREDNLSLATHFVILQAAGTGVSTGLPPGQGQPLSGAGAGGLLGGLIGGAGGAAAGTPATPSPATQLPGATPATGLPGTGLGSSVLRSLGAGQ